VSVYWKTCFSFFVFFFKKGSITGSLTELNTKMLLWKSKMLKAVVGCVVLSLQEAVALHEPACCARHNTHSTLLCRMCLIRDGHFGAPRTTSRHISLRGGRSEILDERIENGKTQIQSEQLKEAHVVMRGVLTILAFSSFSSLLNVLLIPFGVVLFDFPSDNLFPVGQSCVMHVHIMARYTHSIHTSSHQHTLQTLRRHELSLLKLA
jgi:hypothetical protein